MKTFQWDTRTIITVSIALLLTASVGVMGIWLLLSGQPGTGMMEGSSHPDIMGGTEMSGDHVTMMGAPADLSLIHI